MGTERKPSHEPCHIVKDARKAIGLNGQQSEGRFLISIVGILLAIVLEETLSWDDNIY